jgi:hypothetical protein
MVNISKRSKYRDSAAVICIPGVLQCEAATGEPEWAPRLREDTDEISFGLAEVSSSGVSKGLYKVVFQRRKRDK